MDRPGDEKKKRREAKAAEKSGEMSESYDDVEEEVVAAGVVAVEEEVVAAGVVAVEEEGRSRTRW